MEEQKKNSGGMIVIIIAVLAGVLFVGIAVIGILAAIAIPAFLRYVKLSKMAEAESITRQLGSYAQQAYMGACEFPPPLEPTCEVVCGGEKCLPNDVPEAWRLTVPSLGNPNYFSYAAQPMGDQYIITATADFNCGGPMHVTTVLVQGERDGDLCRATVTPPVKTNELE